MFFSTSTGGFYDPEINLEMPDDAVEVTAQEYAQFQASGGLVSADADGRPVMPQIQAPNAALMQIAELEASVTPTRIREAVLGIDNGWLKRVNDQINQLREAST